MTIVWPIVGVLMIVVPFFLYDTPTDPWGAVIAGAIGGALFLIALFTTIIRTTPFPKRTKIFSTTLFVIVLAAAGVSWKTMYDMSHYQRKTLGTIRTIIGEGIQRSFTATVMLPSFREYYAKNQRTKLPIGKVFLALNKDRIHPGYFTFDDEYGASFLKVVSDTSITLVMVETVAKGRDVAFKNFNGQAGRLQGKAILTERGVRYEREN